MSSVPICCTAIATVLLRDDGKVLLMKRSKGAFAELWCQTTGRVSPGEKAWQAAVREVKEETGLIPDELYSSDFCDHFYNPIDNTIETVPIFVATIPNDITVVLNHEHTDYCWVSIEDAITMVPFVGHRTALNEVKKYFIDTSPPMSWLKIPDYAKKA